MLPQETRAEREICEIQIRSILLNAPSENSAAEVNKPLFLPLSPVSVGPHPWAELKHGEKL